MKTRFIILIGAIAVLLGSCASAPPRSPQDASRLNGVSCQFLGLESIEGAGDSDSDSVALLAVYRFAEPGAAASKRPLSLKFQVNRSRVGALRDHLSARPEVLCSPDEQSNYTARVEPFDGIPGIPQR